MMMLTVAYHHNVHVDVVERSRELVQAVPLMTTATPTGVKKLMVHWDALESKMNPLCSSQFREMK